MIMHMHTDDCTPQNCDISGAEWLARHKPSPLLTKNTKVVATKVITDQMRGSVLTILAGTKGKIWDVVPSDPDGRIYDVGFNRRAGLWKCTADEIQPET